MNSETRARSTSIPINGDSDHHTMDTTAVEQHPSTRGRTIRNNAAFFILAHGIYFNENFFSSIVSCLVEDRKSAIPLLFLQLPMFLIKLLFLSVLDRISPCVRVYGSFVGFALSAIFVLIPGINRAADRGSNTVSVVFIYSFSAICMAICEVTVMGLAVGYSRSCMKSWASGNGMAGITGGALGILVSSCLEKNGGATNAGWFSLFFALVSPLAYTALLTEPKFPAINGKGNGHHNLEHDEAAKHAKPKVVRANNKPGPIKKLLLLFSSQLAWYSVPFLLDYLFYFMSYGGVISVIKHHIVQDGGSKSAMSWAFFCLKTATFLCKCSPYFIDFQKLHFVLSLHILSFVLLLVCAIQRWQIGAVVSIAMILGVGHGVVGAFVGIAIRKRVQEPLLTLGLAYISLASSLGATLGSGIGFGVSALFTK